MKERVEENETVGTPARGGRAKKGRVRQSEGEREGGNGLC